MVFLLGAADTNGKGCSCRRSPPDTGVVDQQDEVEIPTPAVTLQVTSIDPARGEAGKGFSAMIYGSGFDSGAVVHFGGTQGPDAQVKDENTISVDVPGLAEGTYDVVVTNPDGTRSTLHQGLAIEQSVPQCSFLRVYFEFDRFRLVPDAEQALNDFVPCYQDTPGTILLEGHTDERGTVEYNLALGQRRADSVGRYLSAHGVAPSRLQTVSYGEERPADPGHDEQAWAKNRRVDIHAGQ